MFRIAIIYSGCSFIRVAAYTLNLQTVCCQLLLTCCCCDWLIVPCFGQASPLADLLAFNNIKTKLGGRVRLILSGAAPLSQKVQEFLSVSMCAPVVQGYGLTETCAASSIAEPFRWDTIGTVGAPMPGGAIERSLVGLMLRAAWTVFALLCGPAVTWCGVRSEWLHGAGSLGNGLSSLRHCVVAVAQALA